RTRARNAFGAARGLRPGCISTISAAYFRNSASTMQRPVPPNTGRRCVRHVSERRSQAHNCAFGRKRVAQAPNAEELSKRFGPDLNYRPPGGWQRESDEPGDKLVKTHCCFCGQQCGIQLKVRENRVIGFEPWEDFPFNRGMLCPKGVKRYLQGSHPDRLLDP